MIGDLSDILISDKTDGIPMYLVVEDSKKQDCLMVPILML